MVFVAGPSFEFILDMALGDLKVWGSTARRLGKLGRSLRALAETN